LTTSSLLHPPLSQQPLPHPPSTTSTFYYIHLLLHPPSTTSYLDSIFLGQDPTPTPYSLDIIILGPHPHQPHPPSTTSSFDDTHLRFHRPTTSTFDHINLRQHPPSIKPSFDHTTAPCFDTSTQLNNHTNLIPNLFTCPSSVQHGPLRLQKATDRPLPRRLPP
jgi:hypothetical protein